MIHLGKAAERTLLGGVVVILAIGGVATYAKANALTHPVEYCAEIRHLPKGATWRVIETDPVSYGLWEYPSPDSFTIGYSQSRDSAVYRYQSCLPGV